MNTEELSPSIAADQQENEKENRIHSLENDLLLERQIFERNKEEFQQKILDLEVAALYFPFLTRVQGTNSRKSDQIAGLQSTQLLLQV